MFVHINHSFVDSMGVKHIDHPRNFVCFVYFVCFVIFSPLAGFPKFA